MFVVKRVDFLYWATGVDWGLTSMLVVCSLLVSVTTDPNIR